MEDQKSKVATYKDFEMLGKFIDSADLEAFFMGRRIGGDK